MSAKTTDLSMKPTHLRGSLGTKRSNAWDLASGWAVLQSLLCLVVAILATLTNAGGQP
ncbi:hypothetical protein [Nitrospirillum viridazoti]|uniref:hypothetical protein n=1 Tax=Nitrospirillum viridazoti TaxID=3144925 RepID=UPI0011AD35FC|nr:hypothetical protein [Nitrospirillum amazonense]TWB33061.1 hypothetical protein FBZ91_115123 [Nitrospirillum amazonense]